MITAHLPSGYVLARMSRWSGAMMFAAMLGAIFPDFDLLAFYFIDDRAIHHHRYWVHAPAFALGVSALALALAQGFANRYRGIVIAFAAGWLLHIVLDSLTGGIMWFWPISNDLLRLFEVPPRDGVHFLIAFLTHWTMLFEAVIWGAALVLFLRHRRDAA